MIVAILPLGETPADEYDTVVVGAGPVGLAFALEAADAGAQVLLVDAGDLQSGKRNVVSRASTRTEILDPARHAPLELTTRRGIGGTSWLWGGRCVPFEPIDFEPRDFVPGGAWPIRHADVEPWYRQTALHLDCGAAVFRADRPDWAGLKEFRMSNLERWARRPKLAPRLGQRALVHPRIAVLMSSSLQRIEFASDGSVASLIVDRAGVATALRARSYVLAMGGLEVTRFLLAVQRERPATFGGAGGPLGRYYMGHATGSIADIVLDDPARAADLDFVRDESGTYVRRRFTLSEEAQRRHRVLNTSFYLDNPPFYEHEHRNATLSLVFLGLVIPPVGRRILAEGIRLRHVGLRPYRIAAHIGNVLRRPWRAAADVADILARRYVSAVRKPGFVLRNEGGRYALHYHAEQLPNPDSRLTLRMEADGASVLEVDFRYLEDDIDSLLRCHDLLDQELRTAGVGHLEYLAASPAAVRAMAWEQATDGFHSIGTTRMSADPAAGVVDRDCRVHGTSNLYIASSSVFPTSGEANPTFLAAALAVRLAHHLMKRSAAEPSGAPARRPTSGARAPDAKGQT